MTTDEALQNIFDYLNGGGEGLAFNFAHLTDEVSLVNSFLVSGSASGIIPSGRRGIWTTGQDGATGCICAGGSSFPITLELNLNNGRLSANWTDAGGTQNTVDAMVHLLEQTSTPGTIYLFTARDAQPCPFHVLSVTQI